MEGETRKLQKVGGGTFTVSVPKEWATEHTLEAGETVHLFPAADGSLVVRSDGEDAPRSVTVDVEDGDGVEGLLAAAYAAGVERVAVAGEGMAEDTSDGAADGASEGTVDAARIARQVAAEHTGMEVVGVDGDSVSVRTLLDPGQVSIQRTVVQLQYVALSMHRTAVDAVLGNGDVDVDRLDDRHAEASRLGTLLERQFDRAVTDLAALEDVTVDRATLFDCYRTSRQLLGVTDDAMAIVEEVDSVEDVGSGDGSTSAFRTAADRARRRVERATTAVVEEAAVERALALRGEAESVPADLVETDGHAARLAALLAETDERGWKIERVALTGALRRTAES